MEKFDRIGRIDKHPQHLRSEQEIDGTPPFQLGMSQMDGQLDQAKGYV